jgi:tetracycline resistance efflux pump
VLALFSRSVFIALLTAILIGEFLISAYHPLTTLLLMAERFWGLLNELWVLKTLAFAMMVGSVMTLIERSGGIDGLVHELSTKRSLVTSKRAALMPSFIAGIIIFIESSITSLVAGAIGRPFCDRYGISRAKLAFVCDSTSAPVCSIIAINGWGALLLGLIGGQIAAGLIVGEEARWLISAIGYNFYAYITLIVTFVTIWYNIDIGPMKHAIVSKPSIECEDDKGSFGLFVWPIIWMICGVLIFMLITGNGNLLTGSGSSSIFYTLIVTLLLMFGYYRYKNVMSSSDFLHSTLQGAKSMAPIASILLLAFAIGGVSSDMHVGQYLASFMGDYLPSPYLPAAIFILSAIIAFATGTSWGTFSIMLPIAIPLAVGLDAPVALAMGAVISGGVFGDHCSPISDTTIISAMASGCSVQEHTKTQLPYALISAGISLVLFIGVGLLIA